VQQERVDVRAEIGDQKRRLMRHEAADEMHVARKPVEFGDGDRARLSVAAGASQGGGGSGGGGGHRRRFLRADTISPYKTVF
jgi:hypothetical protein